MLLKSIVRAVGGTLLLASLMPVPAQATANPHGFSQVIAFGDSLTDTGRFFALSTTYFGPGKGLPQVPYWNGRFSNGQVAVEFLADGLGVSLNDYAYGGANSGFGGQLPGTGLRSQVGLFANDLGLSPADPNALYFVWGGANDLRGIAAADVPTTIASTVENLSIVVRTLYELGARSFLLPNMPDLGKIPETISSGDPVVMGGATFVSGLFNQQLSNAYGLLASTLSGEHFTYFDIMDAQGALIAGAPGNGFVNTTEGCFSGYVGLPGTVCADASGFMFWDKAHPSAAMHAVLGAQMLAAVPEPQTMLMMAVGVLGLLGVMRRRPQA